MARPGGKQLRAETAVARQLYLYGAGDGKRITNIPRLSVVSGVTEQTLRVHLPSWEKEFEEIVLGSQKTVQALRLGAEELTLHRKALETLADQLRQVQFELEKFDEITASLEGICNNFSLNTENGDAALRLLENYLSARGSKDLLRKTFMAMHKQYADLTGILDLKDVQATSAKELEKGRVRIQLKKEAAEELPRNVTPETGSLTVFER